MLAGRRHGETPAEEDDYLVPKGDCEVQLLSPALWRKIVHRYPFIQEIAGKAITKALAERAARKLGVMPSTPEVLQFSKVCRHLSLVSFCFVSSRRHRVVSVDVELACSDINLLGVRDWNLIRSLAQV